MYRVDVLVQGFPGKAICHGGLGWSTVTLLRGEGRTILVDVGAFGVRRELRKQLEAHGVTPQDVTDVFLTHAHYDHAVNFVLFPNATVWIGERELAWAAAQPPGFNPLPELYVAELSRSERVRRVQAQECFLPGIRALAAPGHTPGHLLLYLQGNEVPVLFTGDAAKNRAELLSREVDATGDVDASRHSIESIWERWRRVRGTVLIPGHDLSMVLGEDGQPRYLGERKAAIAAWFSESIHAMSTIDLTESGVFGPAYREG
jgi:glyoxylase-like metal-dependent hydrolase (beta-lactamase superfamily II)